MLQSSDVFIEVGSYQISKYGQGSPGDVFLSERSEELGRTICISADGLGSGIKANVLATLTATMAMNYIKSDIDIKRASEIIMDTLPVCSVRKVGYSTFTIVDISASGTVRMIEYDNPPSVFVRDGNTVELERNSFEIETGSLGKREMKYATFQAQRGDRLAFFSDGVTQSGMGSKLMPLGWGDSNASSCVLAAVQSDYSISSRLIAKKVVHRALKNDNLQAKDDISCSVITFRKPRRTLIVTGPPFRKENDSLLASKYSEFIGSRVICGGTTANIIARECGGQITMDLTHLDPPIPPASKLAGATLVTEGTLTLSRALEYLKQGGDIEQLPANPASRLVEILLDSDCIHFVVGTKINEAHQDPNLPASLDIRRNLLKDMVSTLNKKYLKSSSMELI